jgi:ActR/RegA family two-component response regulator
MGAKLAKRILVVAHDRPLKETRVRLLQSQGYSVDSVETDDDAMKLLETEHYDLVLLGHQSALPVKGIDQRLRERFPNLATLKIELVGVRHSDYPTRVSDPAPQNVIAALHEMLGDDDVELTPIQLPVRCDQSPSA